MDSIINKAKGAMSGSSGTATGPSTNQGNANTGTNAPGQDYGDKGMFSSFLLFLALPSTARCYLAAIPSGLGWRRTKAEDTDAGRRREKSDE
ncbi:hypothetical protein CJF31_00011907 [Rutstroemia sp. NJR-2017a BVV2]|nr:hypothetical protein CJF31_00011907 [Rutstroemia sp. NJR-2017a BVV2]